ncbi:MAG TPA: lipopolysaccharide biosynthesis protein [Paludibacter sp.]|nr:lipopolysaccharide biosynthesis protein [Paludibacter sp.]
MSSKQQAIKGVVWSGIERFSVQIIQFVVTIILARILSPIDFGVVAIILVLMNILQVFNEVGFGAALMQKLDREELDYSTVFVFNIAWSSFLYLILFIVAPLFATFFKLPELTSLTRILGLNLVIASFVVVQRTKLFILVDFKTQAKASFVAVIVSGIVSIYYAYKGLGVMAIIIQQLTNNVINTMFIWIYTKWQPKLQFSYERFKVLFNYAYKLILARFVNVVFQEIYSLAIGKVYFPAQLGYFNRAKSFVSISSNNITQLVQRVAIPILCEEQENKLRMGNVLTEFIQKTAFVVYPLLCGLFVLAEPLIRVLLTDKWLPAAWMLQVLCPVGMLFVISTFNMTVFNATGRTDLALKAEIIKKTLNILILVGAIMISFEALIISQIVVAIIDFWVDTWFVKKQIGLSLLKQLKSINGIFVAALAMAAVIKMTTFYLSNDVLKLIVGFGSGTLFYFMVSYLFDISEFRKIAISTTNKLKR